MGLMVKCDGKKFKDGIECTSQKEIKDVSEHPFRWIHIKGDIKNDAIDAHLLQGGGVNYYFCSKQCLMDRLFINETI